MQHPQDIPCSRDRNVTLALDQRHPGSEERHPLLNPVRRQRHPHGDCPSTEPTQDEAPLLGRARSSSGASGVKVRCETPSRWWPAVPSPRCLRLHHRSPHLARPGAALGLSDAHAGDLTSRRAGRHPAQGPTTGVGDAGLSALRSDELTAALLVRLTDKVDRECFVGGEGWRRPPFERGLRHDKQSAAPDLDDRFHTPASSMRTSPSPVAGHGSVKVEEPARRAPHPWVHRCGHGCTAPANPIC